MHTGVRHVKVGRRGSRIAANRLHRMGKVYGVEVSRRDRHLESKDIQVSWSYRGSGNTIAHEESVLDKAIGILYQQRRWGVYLLLRLLARRNSVQMHKMCTYQRDR